MIRILQKSLCKVFKIEKNNNSLQSIEILRGLAALSVCFFHFSNSTLPTIKPNFLSSFFSYGYLGVHVFFVISGYIIPYSLFKKNYELKQFGNFISKRFLRLAPPAYVAIGLIFLFYYSAILIKGKPVDGMYWPGTEVKTIFLNLVFLVSAFNSGWYIDVFWTLEAEIVFYIFIGLVLPIITVTKARGKRQAIIMSIGILFIFLSTISDFQIIPFLKYFIFFNIGLLLFLFQSKLISRSFFEIFFSVNLILCYASHNLITALVALISALLINQKRIGLSFLTFLGTISYSLYITHHFSGVISEIILKNLTGEILSEYQKVFMLFVYVIISILFSVIFYKTIERPFIQFSKK